MKLRLLFVVAVMCLALACDQKQITSFTGQRDAPDDLMITSDWVYFSESVTTTSLLRVPINGGQPETLVSELSPFVRGTVTHDDAALYWWAPTADGGTGGGAIFTAALDGSSVRSLAEVETPIGAQSGLLSSSQLFAAAGHLYWTSNLKLWSLDVQSGTPTSLYEYAPSDGGTTGRFQLVSADARGLYFLDDTELKLMPLLGGATTAAVPVLPIVGVGGVTVTPTHAYWSSNGLAGSVVRAPLDGVDHPEVVFKQDGIALHSVTLIASEGENVCFITGDVQLNTTAVQCLKGDKTVGLAQGSGRRFYGLKVAQDFAWFFDTSTGSTKAALFKVALDGSADAGP